LPAVFLKYKTSEVLCLWLRQMLLYYVSFNSVMYIKFRNSHCLTTSSCLRFWCQLVHYYFTACHCTVLFSCFAVSALK
jgi:hypothetical protein